MEIAILTQDNALLINSYTRQLAQGLKLLGFDVVIFRTSATARGKPTSKLTALREVLRYFGLLFLLRGLLSALASKVKDRPSRFPDGCRIVEVPDSQKTDAAFFRAHCQEFNVLLILAGTRIIRREVLDLWTHGVLNVHSSILPYARGVMPALWTYVNKTHMGVTLFRLDEGIDTGAIVRQIPIETPASSYFDHLRHTKEIGVQLILSWVYMHLVPQPEEGAVIDKYFTYPTSDFRLR